MQSLVFCSVLLKPSSKENGRQLQEHAESCRLYFYIHKGIQYSTALLLLNSMLSFCVFIINLIIPWASQIVSSLSAVSPACNTLISCYGKKWFYSGIISAVYLFCFVPISIGSNTNHSSKHHSGGEIKIKFFYV